MSPHTPLPTTKHRALIIMLRIIGVMSVTAVVPCVMPTSWIAAAHAWLGLGAFPDTPITQYLARSVSALYAILGVLLIVMSNDIDRYEPIIRWFLYSALAFGVVITGVDWIARLPLYWTLQEGPLTVIFAIVFLRLLRRAASHEDANPR